jgi:uncharacterized protein (DUF2252 family)
MPDIRQEILHFNQGRDRDLLKLKFQKMRDDAFVFLRGTDHLFYAHWPSDSPLNKTPLSWACGDLHLANFGCYKGDDREVYFDINDFDEAVLAPCSWDIVRLITSLLVAQNLLKLSQEQTLNLAKTFLIEYFTTLAQAVPKMLNLENACGPVKFMLENLGERSRDKLLDKYTVCENKQRNFFASDRVQLITRLERSRVGNLVENLVSPQKKISFKVLDVARRVVGTGSLGLERYVILIEGKGSPDQNYLLELKIAASPSLIAYLPSSQPVWRSEAARILAVRNHLQAVLPALLLSVETPAKSFILRELQPREDGVDLKIYTGKPQKLESLLETMAKVLAWDQLRASSWKGADGAAKLSAFARAEKSQGWARLMLDTAQQLAEQVRADYQIYVTAYDRGDFNL